MIAPYRRGLLGMLLLGVCAGLGSGCRSDDPRAPEEVVVFAAASLREPLEKLARDWESDTPGVGVLLHLSGTQHLRTQLEHGARADVFLSADANHIAALRANGLVSEPQRIACNGLVVIVPADAPTGARRFEDLSKARRIVLAAPEVPVGAYAEQVLEKASLQFGADFTASVRNNVVSREFNTRQVLSKVLLGEADAALVYRTDARVGGTRVRAIEVPEPLQPTAEIFAAIPRDAPSPKRAEAFLGLLSGPAGARAFEREGFIACPGAPR